MKCPECQFDNREGAKFCIECGTKLEINCSKCSHLNPPASKFCEECGFKLNILTEQAPQELSFDEKIAKIQKYLPKGVTEKILAQKDRIEGERKEVTVMFCDLEGFTQLSEKLGPEDAYTIMDQVYEILIQKVRDFDGTVNEMTGDGIMALFGAPIALEDAPQRAIRSSLAIHREMAKLCDRLKEKYTKLPSLKMRIGIHSGPVVVGTLGNDLRVDFKAVGDTVNLASRMEQLANAGNTYITEEIFKSTEGLFRFEALGKRDIKGKKEPVDVYQVIAYSSLRTRFDVSAEKGLTPFIGRGHDLELLLDRFERAKEGRGQAVSIVSEAGIGKSRLLYEFRKAILNENVTFLEGKCLSYTKNIAYFPIIDILKLSFDLKDRDGDLEIKTKLKEGLKIIGANETATLPYLLELLSVKESGIEKISMSLESMKERIIEALKRIVLMGSEIRPLILAIEDLHWIDNSSADSLKDLLDSISGSKVFLIFTYRPEFFRGLGRKSYHSQITLSALSNRESIDLVRRFLDIEYIDSDLEDLIIKKTEGVPFFIEEFVKSLKDLNLIERKGEVYSLAADIKTLKIPSTIQAVIMPRVDALVEGAKEALQTASAIGREFGYGLIQKVTGISDQALMSHLADIQDSELLYERGMFPQSFYIFKHALTQEVVYNSILSKNKESLHEKIGNSLEELFKDSINEYYVILMEHYIAGKNWQKGAKYSNLAAKKARKTGSLFDAIAFSEKGIDCLEKLPQAEKSNSNLIDRRTTLGLYNLQIGHHVEAKKAVDPIFEMVSKSKNNMRIAQTYTIFGAYNIYIREDIYSASNYLEKAIAVSKEGNDLISNSLANFWLAVAMILNCEFSKGINSLESVLDINLAVNNVWGIASIKSHMSQIANWQGLLTYAYQMGEEAVQLAEDSGDIYSKAQAYANLGLSCYRIGFLEKAAEYLLRSFDYCEKINLEAYIGLTSFYLAETFFDLGEYSKSKNYYKKAISALKNIKAWPSFRNLNKAGVAKAELKNGSGKINLESIFTLSSEIKFKLFAGWICRYMSEILLSIDDNYNPEACKWIEKAIEADRNNHMLFDLGKDFSIYTELFKRKKEKSKAKATLCKAINIFRECGADGWVKKYEKKLAEL